MNDKRELVTDTNLNVLRVKKLENYIFEGSEGKVYALDDNSAVKIFKLDKDNIDFSNKFAKIEMLSKLSDPSFTFPKGLVTLDGLYKAGYYMKRIVQHPIIGSFAELGKIKKLPLDNPLEFLFDILIKTSDALDRAHSLGLIVGDIKWGNILIDKDLNPIFVDTDNYAYDCFGFDVRPIVTYRLFEMYKEYYSSLDNDNFLFGYMAMRELFGYFGVTLNDTESCFCNAMQYIDSELREEIRTILSDSYDKPSIGSVLKRVKNRQEFIKLPKYSQFNILMF